MAAELAQAERDGGHLAVVLLDLDDFKEVNDTLGHEAGGDLLRLVVNVLRRGLRRTTRSPGWGATSSPSCSTSAGRRWCSRSAGCSLPLPKHAPASAGIAAFPGDGVDANGLCRHADAQLYSRKVRPRRMRAKKLAGLR